MDWNMISSAIVVSLMPYFASTGHAVAEKFGEDIYVWLKGKFAKENNKAVKSLDTLKEQPSSQEKQLELADEIREMAINDPEGFGNELKKRLEPARISESDLARLEGILSKKLNTKLIINYINHVDNMYF